MTRSHPDKMTFLEHLEELRSRLVRIALYLAGGFGACWGFHEQIFGFLTQPLRRAGFSDQFIYTSPAEAFFLYMKMSFFVGIFVAFPFILWEIWAFISPGLYRHEKLWAIPFIGMGSFLWGFAGPDMRFLPRIGEYWSFYSWFLLGIGAVFQIPVVIFVLARIGLVSARMLLKGWKWAILAAFVLAAIITPSADVVTQTALAGPMIGLYLLGVVIAWIFGRKRSGEEEDDEETVSEAARS
jgi:sec-independent protein translocase protein TatC